MSESLLGLTVTRAIPPEVVTGLLTGQYKLYGGVIRWATNTDSAGQIVRHLVPVAQHATSSLATPASNVLAAANMYQLQRLAVQLSTVGIATQQLLQIASSTMVLSGLNLTVTAIGFATLSERIKSLEGRLLEIQEDVKAIRQLLELEERSELAAALRDLLNITNVRNVAHRNAMLLNTKNVLAPISLKYKELLAAADTPETALAYEEYYSLTSLAHTRCLAELGMLEMARRDLEEVNTFWRNQAQRIANDLLLGEHPERFLFSDFVHDVPVSTVVDWLDFVRGEERGYDWLDDLRANSRSWYSDEPASGKGATKATTSLWSRMAGQSQSTRAKALARDRETVIPALQKFTARSRVLDGFTAQYELLEEHDVTPTEFEQKLASINADELVDGFLILQPVKHAV